MTVVPVVTVVSSETNHAYSLQKILQPLLFKNFLRTFWKSNLTHFTTDVMFSGQRFAILAMFFWFLPLGEPIKYSWSSLAPMSPPQGQKDLAAGGGSKKRPEDPLGREYVALLSGHLTDDETIMFGHLTDTKTVIPHLTSLKLTLCEATSLTQRVSCLAFH